MVEAWNAGRAVGLGTLHRSLTDHVLTSLYLQVGGGDAYEKLLRSDHVQRRWLAEDAGDDPDELAPWPDPSFPLPPGGDPKEPRTRKDVLSMKEMMSTIHASHLNNPAKKMAQETYVMWYRAESHFTTHASLSSYGRYLAYDDDMRWRITLDMEPDIAPAVRIAIAGFAVSTNAASYAFNRQPDGYPLLRPLIRRWAELRGRATVVYADMEKELPPPYGTKRTEGR
jgi:hypothetical protein